METQQLDLPLSGPVDHFGTVHPGKREGTVLVWRQDAPDSHNRWLKIEPEDDPDLYLEDEIGQPSVFLTPNEFHKWRKIGLLKALRSCWCDIDNPKLSVTAALTAVSERSLPPPSLLVESGAGIHLYWLIEAEQQSALPLWQEVQDKLIRELHEIGSDKKAKDCARVLRITGTVNQKNGATVKGQVITGKYWKLGDLATSVLEGYRPLSGEVRDLSVARARKTGKFQTKPSIYQRWFLVYQDLLKIIDFKFGGQVGVNSKSRDWLLFHLAVALSWFAGEKTLKSEIDWISRMHFPSLTEDEVDRFTSTVVKRALDAAEGKGIEWRGQIVDPRYRFKRETLWENLKHLIPDELVPELRAIVPDEVIRERKTVREGQRRKEAGAMSREDFIERSVNRKEEALKLREQGLKQREIAGILGITQARVSQLLRKI